MAYVHSLFQGGVAKMLPSPYAFNHVIVRAQVAGRTEWVDATLTLQRGALGKRSTLPYAQALVLKPGTTGLEAIPHPVPEAPLVDVRYRLSLEDSGSGTFHITSRYVGVGADAMRAWLVRGSAEQRATQQLDQRRGFFPHLKQAAPPVLTDDEQANVVTMEEQYTLEKAWDTGAVGIGLELTASQLSLPGEAERTFPLALSHPTHVRERWEVQAGTVGSLDVREKTVDGPASRFVSNVHHGPGGLVLEGEYQTLADRVTLEDLPRHLDAVKEMRGLTGITLPAPVSAVVSRKPADWEPSRTTSLLISTGVLVTLGLLLLGVPGRLRRWSQARKLRKQARPLPKVPSIQVRKPQEVAQPSGPIVVDGSEAQMEAAIREQRCTCGGSFMRAPDIARLASTGSDGPKLRVLGRTTVRLRCMSCEELRVLTFDVRPD
jgi:hypothetical protein